MIQTHDIRYSRRSSHVLTCDYIIEAVLVHFTDFLKSGFLLYGQGLASSVRFSTSDEYFTQKRSVNGWPD